MEEQEVPLEQVQEDMHHHAHGTSEKWVMGVALRSHSGGAGGDRWAAQRPSCQ